jgi:hypothetical protein
VLRIRSAAINLTEPSAPTNDSSPRTASHLRPSNDGYRRHGPGSFQLAAANPAKSTGHVLSVDAFVTAIPGARVLEVNSDAALLSRRRIESMCGKPEAETPRPRSRWLGLLDCEQAIRLTTTR